MQNFFINYRFFDGDFGPLVWKEPIFTLISTTQPFKVLVIELKHDIL